jgi:hypothetical protein
VSRPIFLLILLRKTLTSFNLQQIVEAKELYKADVGSSFPLDHCWVILHHSPKWQEKMDKLALQNKKETKKQSRPPSSAPSSKPYSVKETKDKDEKEDTTLGLLRPEGCKAAKNVNLKQGKHLKARRSSSRFPKRRCKQCRLLPTMPS